MMEILLEALAISFGGCRAEVGLRKRGWLSKGQMESNTGVSGMYGMY